MPIQFATKVLKELENESSNLSDEELEQVKAEIKGLREQLDRLEAVLLVQELEQEEDPGEKQSQKSRDIYGRKKKNKPKQKRDFYGRVINKPWLKIN